MDAGMTWVCAGVMWTVEMTVGSEMRQQQAGVDALRRAGVEGGRGDWT